MKSTSKKVGRQQKARQELLAFALAFPETHEDHPWGELVAKVRRKIFVFMGRSAVFEIAVKLPESKFEALLLPFTEPTSYGLGKSGWVTARFEASQDVPLGLLSAWIEESYRAVAPKTLVKQLDVADAGDPPAPKKRRKA